MMESKIQFSGNTGTFLFIIRRYSQVCIFRLQMKWALKAVTELR
ncbi:hypothetical protein [[Clostridium] fimetarium]|nr:hypothetical protein [[Clostridium] fimetarium]